MTGKDDSSINSESMKFASRKMFSGLGKTLFLWFLAISLVPLTIMSLVSFRNAHSSLRKDAIQSLSASLKDKKKFFAAYFSERLKDITLQTDLQVNIELLIELRQAFLKSGLPVEEFINTIEYRNITANRSYDIGNFAAIYGYYDVLLIDVDGGVLFSVMGEDDLGTNIFTDKFADTEFSRACWETLETGQPVAGDLEFYAPTNNALVLFLGKAMVDANGEKIGLMAFKMPIHQINDIMQESTGLGNKGQAYLVGKDLLMRSDSRFEEQSSMLKRRIDTEVVRNWMNSEKVFSEIANPEEYRQAIQNGEIDSAIATEGKMDIYQGPYGDDVLGGYTRLDSLENLGLKWIMIAEINVDEAFRPVSLLRKIVYGLATGTGIFVVLLALTVTRRIIVPVRELSRWSRRIASGDLSYSDIHSGPNEIGELAESFKVVVDSFRGISDVCQAIAIGDYSKSIELRSDKDSLSTSVNQMAENLRAVVRQANAVAEGDYSTEILPKSDKDELAIALLNMTTRLSEMTDDNEKQDWFKAGYNELNDVMRGINDLELISNNIIAFLAEYLNAFVGAFYVLNDQKVLVLAGGYAHKQEADFPKEFKIGEALVGQVARDGSPMLIEEVPLDYIKIDSGLGDSVPHSLAVVPFYYNQQVSGVIELGAFHRFSHIQMEFLERVVDNIGIAIESANAHRKMTQLLDQTRKQAEKLKLQQDELWKSNEVLEEQTKALEESEKHLQSQQEELRVANEELEERTQALEEQRDAIRTKNKELEFAQLEIKQKANELEIANTYKSEFLANMSHELRTPLNSILILSQLLSSDEKHTLSEKQLEYASTIHSSGGDLLTLINEILDLAKVESGKMELHPDNMDLIEFTQGIERLFKPVAKDKGLDFTINIETSVPEIIKTDVQRVQQIVRNLASNAFKFTHKGGVTLSIGRPSADVDLSKSGLRRDNAIAISVADTGIGVPGHKKDLIFEPFQQADGTTSRQYGGTGLGLSISREFARFLGGELHMESEEGQGTVFILYLPEKIQEETEKDNKQENKSFVRKPYTREKEVQVTSGPGEQNIEDNRRIMMPGDQTLLIIEDDLNFAKVLIEQANSKGFKCFHAEDGETGLHFADFHKPCAIILDIGLPGIDGWEVMERLKENPDTRHIPVHFISAEDSIIEAMQMGAIGFLTKPVTLDKLNMALLKIKKTALKSVKKLLIVEDDDVQRKSIMALIGNGDVEITDAATGERAWELLNKERFDCMILDLGLKDISGFDLLEKIKTNENLSKIPIIVNTGRDLSREEEAKLQRYTDSIIVKGVRSAERLLDETNLFLHRIEANLPPEKQRVHRISYDKEAVLNDKTILLVDDDMRNIFAIASVLEEKGMKIIIARNGIESLEKLDKKPEIELVLMDIMMPEMDGYEAMQRIREQGRFKDLPIIALTAKAMKGDKNKCIEAGANDYLAKPVDIDKLLSLLRVWLYKQH
ncbi:MAG: response regulator [Proteobacteria bacterium]|nr:response regulator [Pseudomonadota bacterium]MBU1711323.1 response regulator [Pseudomonadota bacterium]